MIDLHIHTNNSDGLLSTNEIIKKASLSGCSIISITDHNSIKAYSEIDDNLGLTIIPGVEIDADYTKHYDDTFHILAYNFDFDKMQTYLDKINNQNIKQIKKYIKLFQKNINPNISFKEFTMMYQGTLSIARLLKYLAKKGYVESIEQILCEYNLISNYDSLKLTVESLKATGAKVILAHPWRYESIYGFSKKQIENIILNLPFDGIEVYYSQNDSNQTKHWVKFAKENNLELTIGSDFHRVAEADRPNKIEIGYGINNNLNFHNQDIINFLLEKEEIK